MNNNQNRNADANGLNALDSEMLSLLPQIGYQVASIWGGECYDFEVDNKQKIVVFHCLEHGEDFVTEVKFSELEKYKAQLD